MGCPVPACRAVRPVCPPVFLPWDRGASIFRLHFVWFIDQNPAVTAEEKRQLIDPLYGAMSQMVHAGNDGFAQIDATMGK
jgi:hypothetical protein